MSKNPRKTLNAAINTDSAMFDMLAHRDNMASQPSRLKERNVKHIKIAQSSIIRDSFSFREQIGQGSYGTVLSVVDKQTNQGWAMKIVNKNAVGNKFDVLQREIQILKLVDHPHIIYLDKVYESTRKVYMILEKCYGELSQVYKVKKRFSQADTRKVIGDLASAVAYLHKHDIVHRDLKMQNILIAQNPGDLNDKLYIKVSDFGLSIIKQGSSYEDMLHDFCGTLVYMAPEIITTHSYSQQCDVWAIGVIMYALLTGRYPFFAAKEQDLVRMICNEEPSASGLSSNSGEIHLITKMLTKNPALRITAAEVILHPWISGKSTINGSESLGNVLDMMRLWRSEMLVPAVGECDWASSAKPAGSSTELTHANCRRSSNWSSPAAETEAESDESTDGSTSPTTSSPRRQAMRLPVKNIRFNRNADESGNRTSVGGSTGRSNFAVGLDERSAGRRGSVTSAPTHSKSDKDATTVNKNSRLPSPRLPVNSDKSQTSKTPDNCKRRSLQK